MIAVSQNARRPGGMLLLALLGSTGIWLPLVTVRAFAAGSGAAVRVGEPAPPFSAPRLEGGRLALRSLRGHPALLNFWSPTCPPCALEMPELEKLHLRYSRRGLRIVGLTEMEAPVEQVRRFLEEHGVTYAILLDVDGRIGRLYQLEAHPTSIVIDEQGIVRYVNPGFLRGEEKEIEAAILRTLPPDHKAGPK